MACQMVLDNIRINGWNQIDAFMYAQPHPNNQLNTCNFGDTVNCFESL